MANVHAAFLAKLLSDTKSNKFMPPATPVVETGAYTWRVPNFNRLKKQWDDGNVEESIKGPDFSFGGVTWCLNINRDREDKTSDTFDIYLHRLHRWEPLVHKFNWCFYGGPSHARHLLLPLREFCFLPENDSDNWGKSGFEFGSCLRELSADNTWELTVVLQRVALKPVGGAVVKWETVLENAYHDTSMHDLKIQCLAHGPYKGNKDVKTPMSTTSVATATASPIATPHPTAATTSMPTTSPGAIDQKLESSADSLDSGESECVSVSRFLMALHSPVAKSMFFGSIKGSESSSGEWDLRPAPRSAVIAMAKHIYSLTEVKCLDTIHTASDALALFELAMRLDMLELSSVASRCVVSKLVSQSLRDSAPGTELVTAKTAFQLTKLHLTSLQPTEDKSTQSVMETPKSLDDKTLVEAQRASKRVYEPAIILGENPSTQCFKVKYVSDGTTGLHAAKDLRPANWSFQQALACTPDTPRHVRYMEYAKAISDAARALLAKNLETLLSL